jgi:hypothetical protein
VIHQLPVARRSLHGHVSRDLEPALVVDPRATQLVNESAGVHAVLRDGVL